MEMGELQPPPEPESSRDTQPTRSRVWPVFLVPVIALLATLAFQIVVAGAVVARELGSGMKPAELSERVGFRTSTSTHTRSSPSDSC